MVIRQLSREKMTVFCGFSTFKEGRIHKWTQNFVFYTRFKEMIRLSAKAIPVPDTEQEEKINPIFRESYTLGAGTLSEKGYVISDRCIGCGKCKKNCPQRCIAEGKPYHIQQEHCLHCGSCYEGCPVKAIEKCRNK